MTKWTPVVGHEGRYEVSDDGQVRSLIRREVRVLKPWISDHGYPQVGLSGPNRRVFIHRLMGEAFLPNPDSLPFVLHADDIPHHNVLSNLRWGTPKQNTDDAMGNGKHPMKALSEKTHCKYGHEFTPENTHIVTRKDGRTRRDCRACWERKNKKGYADHAADRQEYARNYHWDHREQRLAYLAAYRARKREERAQGK